MVLGVMLVMAGILLLPLIALNIATYERGMEMIDEEASTTPRFPRWGWGWSLPRRYRRLNKYLLAAIEVGFVVALMTFGVVRILDSA